MIKRKLFVSLIIFVNFVALSNISPASAAVVNYDTCNEIMFQYQGGRFGEEWKWATQSLQLGEVFGTDSAAEPCQARKYDNTDMNALESVAGGRNRFMFQIIGNYLGTVSCHVTTTLNTEFWFEGDTTYYRSTYSGYPDTQYFGTEELSTSQQARFKEISKIGKNTIRVRPTCPNKPDANLDLEATFNIAQDSFDDFEGISIDNGSAYTNDRKVSLGLSFDSGVPAEVMVSNDGGFSKSSRRIYTYSRNTISWTLDSFRDERMSKTVYLKYRYLDRYTGLKAEKWSNTITDDIILDTTPPSISYLSGSISAISPVAMSSYKRASGTAIKISVKAKDNKSGVVGMQYAFNSNHSNSMKVKFAKILSVLPIGSPSKIWLRVKDGAGNWSTWKSTKISK